MADYPYATVVNKIGTLFEKVKTTGQPSKANFAWLQSIGFKSDNDKRLIPILKKINFVDSTGLPTEKWLKFRADKTILAQGIKEGYQELFAIYPDANIRSKDELVNFFSTKTTAGTQVINKMAATFMELCKVADFSKDAKLNKTNDVPPTKPKNENIQLNLNSAPNLSNLDKNITININIQLTVPETNDDAIYDKFFEALKRHLLPS